MEINAQFDANREAWNLRTAVHIKSEFYGLDAWKANPEGCSLNAIEKNEVGSVDGKTLLHLQCHFGQDTLSWARKGATVTGVDLSDASIEVARALAEETGHPEARFIRCNIFDLPEHLPDTEKFDIIFSSYGVVGWLPDLKPWGELIARYLKPGGFFYLADFHPVVWMMDDNFTFLQYPYLNADVIVTEQTGTYTDRDAPISYMEYGWNHGLSEILNPLVRQGLHLEFLNEHPYSPYNCFPRMVKGADGNYRIEGLENIIPMVYSFKVRK